MRVGGDNGVEEGIDGGKGGGVGAYIVLYIYLVSAYRPSNLPLSQSEDEGGLWFGTGVVGERSEGARVWTHSVTSVTEEV